jgi:LAO/AO transport system kinase
VTSPWADAIRAGDRTALARAITLVESARAEDRIEAEAVLDALRDASGSAHRVGISGAPGAGKSTFIDAVGMHLVQSGRRVAVLAIDPSSMRSGGSILGDKTRMPRLARESHAFIRPTPASGVLGGLARHTRETIALVEAAGFDVVIVETVGVGQSEVDVVDVVDSVVVLVAPGGGDELQGIKRGLFECADVVAVTKADGDGVTAAELARAEFSQAIALVRPRVPAWSPRVLVCSSVVGTGIAEVWAAVVDHRRALEGSGAWDEQRGAQRERAVLAALVSLVRDEIGHDPRETARLAALAPAIRAGTMSAEQAARALFSVFHGEGRGSAP